MMHYIPPEVSQALKSKEAHQMAKQSIQVALKALKEAEDHLSHVIPYPCLTLAKIREAKNLIPHV